MFRFGFKRKIWRKQTIIVNLNYLTFSHVANLKAMITKKKFLNRIRWTARITGTFLVAFTVIFGIGVFIDGLKNNTGSPDISLNINMVLMFLIWGIGLSGLVVALWKEGLGGCISFLGFFTMSILNIFNPEAPNKVETLIIFGIWMIPSILYILYWQMSKNSPNLSDNKEQLS